MHAGLLLLSDVVIKDSSAGIACGIYMDQRGLVEGVFSTSVTFDANLAQVCVCMCVCVCMTLCVCVCACVCMCVRV